MSDIKWTLPHNTTQPGVAVDALWITADKYVICWIDPTNQNGYASIFQRVGGNQTHLHTQRLWTGTGAPDVVKIGIYDKIQIAKVRDNVWVMAYTQALGLLSSVLRMFTWTGSTITDGGVIATLGNQQTRKATCCNVATDKIFFAAVRFQLANIIYGTLGTYNGATWSFSATTSITPAQYASATRLCKIDTGKSLYIYNETPSQIEE